jgi:hypothetical protein
MVGVQVFVLMRKKNGEEKENRISGIIDVSGMSYIKTSI